MSAQGITLDIDFREAMDVRIDVAAQYALVRMSKVPAAWSDAVQMLAAVKQGSLAGIYQEDQLVPAMHAKKMKLGWWQLIPQGEDAALVVDPLAPLELVPLIVFRRQVRDIPSRLDRALRKAWAAHLALLSGKLAQCAMPSSGGGLQAELPGAQFRPSNIVPAVLCTASPVPPPPPKRLRLSVWADPQFVTSSNITGGRGLIDDVSLLRTLSNDAHPVVHGQILPPLQLTFDKKFRPGALDVVRIHAYASMVAQCHANGMQILAGYGIVPNPKDEKEKAIGARFNAWLRDPNRSPTFGEYARKIVHFLMSLSLDPLAPALEAHKRFDGIGLDIESLGGDDGPPFTEFCRELAQQLAPKGMFLAIAAGGMISETKAHQRIAALPSVRATQYKMALGLPNMLIRPMAYDIDLSGKELAQWHEDIINWALNGVGLSPSQFQLGVKTIHGGLNTGITKPPDEVINRCKCVLRANQVGLITFALNRSEQWKFWDQYDRALNPGLAVPGKLGEPLQAPLDPKALSRLTPALPPGSRLATVPAASSNLFRWLAPKPGL